MNKQKFMIISLLSLALLTLSSTQVLAQSEDYEEVTYDQLLDQLSTKKRKVVQNYSSPLNDVMIHFGVGFVGGINNQGNASNTQTSYRYLSGFQLSAGVDLLNPRWMTEAAIRNFGTSKNGNESRSIRDFDLKVVHRNKTSDQIGYRIGAGLGTRVVRISSTNLNESLSQESPTAMLTGGLEAAMTQNVRMGFEISARTALVSETADKHSIDATVRLDTSF